VKNPSLGSYVVFSIDGAFIAQTAMTPPQLGVWAEVNGVWTAPVEKEAVVFKIDILLSRELTTAIENAVVHVDDVKLTLAS